MACLSFPSSSGFISRFTLKTPQIAPYTGIHSLKAGPRVAHRPQLRRQPLDQRGLQPREVDGLRIEEERLAEEDLRRPGLVHQRVAVGQLREDPRVVPLLPVGPLEILDGPFVVPDALAAASELKQDVRVRGLRAAPAPR